jgi:hypothetical protein
MVSTRAALIALFIICTVPSYAADTVFYDGVFDFGKGPTGRWEEAKLRDWLWKHWHQRTAGTAILKWVTMEGEGGTSDYTIAKGNDRLWYLSIHLQGWQRPGSKATRQSGAMSGRLPIQWNESRRHIMGTGPASPFQIQKDCQRGNSSWS